MSHMPGRNDILRKPFYRHPPIVAHPCVAQVEPHAALQVRQSGEQKLESSGHYRSNRATSRETTMIVYQGDIQTQKTDLLRSLVAQPLDPPYSAMGYSYTCRTYVFQVSQGIALYPPKLALSQPRGGWQGVSQLKLPFGGYHAIRGYR